MMLNADIVAVSPSSVYRVLKAAAKLAPRGGEPSKKRQGFEQPLRPHEHWHIDVAYLNICGTFFFMCSILDGYSRSVIHWEIRPTMTEAEVETVLQRAREQYPGEHPRIISDNGSDHRIGVSFDHQDGSALGGWTGHGAIGAYAGVPRHAAKSAKSNRTGNLAWQSWARTGRPGVRAFESGVVDRLTANSPPRTATGHKQDDQSAKTKPPAGSCSRILDQSLGSTLARSSGNRPLE